MNGAPLRVPDPRLLAEQRGSARNVFKKQKLEAIERALAALQAHPEALDPETRATCVLALRVHIRALDDAECEMRAFKAMLEAKPADRWRVYAEARGVTLDPEAQRQQWPAALVVKTYLEALESGALAEPLWLQIAEPDRPLRIWSKGDKETAESFALRATAERWGFKSSEACRRFLWRERLKITEARDGWRSEIDLDAFTLPQGVR